MKRLLLSFMCIFVGIVVLYTLQTVQESHASESNPLAKDSTIETVSPPKPIPTSITCTSWPEGMDMQVTALSSTEVFVQISGLKSGELITLIYERDLQNWQRLKNRLEFHPSQPIGEDGYFEDIGKGLIPLEGIPNRWQIQVLYSQGVACQTITLPESEK